jgi:hypothetical protein
MRILPLLPVFFFAFSGCHPPLETNEKHYVHSGETATLEVKDARTVYVVFDKKDCYDCEVATVTNNHERLDRLVREGKAFTTAPGTRVEVLTESFNQRKIRILDGEAQGRVGWVPFEWLKPAPASKP